MSQIEIVPTPQELHISDDQFSRMLFGAIEPEVRSHLEACPECAAEAERVGSAIGSFERDSRLWAERRAAATQVAYPVRRPILAWLQVPAAWGVAAVAMLIATTVGLPHFDGSGSSTGQRASAAVVTTVSVSTASEVTAAALKSDNELLSAIDGKLSASDTPPAQFYGLQVDEDGAPGSTAHEVSD